MTNETKIWVKKFVETHQTDIENKMNVCKEMNKEVDASQLITIMAVNKKMRYYEAQLDLLKILLFTAI